MKQRFVAGALSMAVFALACSEAPTAPPPSFIVSPGPGTTTITYDGKGWTNGVLNNERCTDLANDGSTGQGVDINAGYLLWILTANGASAATLYGLPGGPFDMIQVGGTFKYVSAYFDIAALSQMNVYAVYAGGKGKATLTVSHGCRGITALGAFCSPGFWRTRDAAWNVFDFPAPSKTDLFSATVQPFAISNVAALSSALSGKTLGDVLATPPISSPIAGYNFGGGPAFNANLDPFNAVGGYLTTLIPLPPGAPGYPGYFLFDPAQVGTSDHFCPLNADGSYKPLPE